MGYLIAIGLQFISVSYQVHYATCTLALAFGAFLFTTTLAKDAIRDIDATSDDLKTGKPKFEIYKKFTALIQMHSDAKQLSTTVHT